MNNHHANYHKQKHGGSYTDNFLWAADMVRQREFRNALRTYDPTLRRDARPCLHGYCKPMQFWRHRLEEMMKLYERKHSVGE